MGNFTDVVSNYRKAPTTRINPLSITHQRMHKLYISLKFIVLKHLKCSYMFRSLDHPQGAYIVPC